MKWAIYTNSNYKLGQFCYVLLHSMFHCIWLALSLFLLDNKGSCIIPNMKIVLQQQKWQEMRKNEFLWLTWQPMAVLADDGKHLNKTCNRIAWRKWSWRCSDYCMDRQVWANSTVPDQTAPESGLIRVYTICQSIYIFWMHSLLVIYGKT